MIYNLFIDDNNITGKERHIQRVPVDSKQARNNASNEFQNNFSIQYRSNTKNKQQKPMNLSEQQSEKQIQDSMDQIQARQSENRPVRQFRQPNSRWIHYPKTARQQTIRNKRHSL
jgi:acid phosphatase class B